LAEILGSLLGVHRAIHAILHSSQLFQLLINALFELQSVFTVYHYILLWTPAAGWAQEVAILPTGHYCVEFG